MATPERVIVDTSALYALRSETDLFHHRASAAYERLKGRRPGVVGDVLHTGRDGRATAPAAGLRGRLGVLGMEPLQSPGSLDRQSSAHHSVGAVYGGTRTRLELRRLDDRICVAPDGRYGVHLRRRLRQRGASRAAATRSRTLTTRAASWRSQGSAAVAQGFRPTGPFISLSRCVP